MQKSNEPFSFSFQSLRQDSGDDRKCIPTEPEVNDRVPIQLTPDVNDCENHRIHEHWETENQSCDETAHPVEEQHIKVVCGSSVVLSFLKTYRVVVQEITVHQELETRRIVEQTGEGPPYLEVVNERRIIQYKIRYADNLKSADQGEEYRERQPISREDRQATKPISHIRHFLFVFCPRIRRERGPTTLYFKIPRREREIHTTF